MTKRKPKEEHKESGRPTKYDPDKHPEAVFTLALSGFTDKQIASSLLISEATLNNWKKEYPEFLESIREAKEDADAKVANSLYQRAMGYTHTQEKIVVEACGGDGGSVAKTMEFQESFPPDVKAMQFWLKNRKSKKWKDKQEVEHSVDNNLAEIIKARRKKALGVIGGRESSPDSE